MKSKLCELLNLKYPIIQGAMAWIADSSLASAVSEAGGLGILAAGNAPPDEIRKEIRKIKEKTNKPFGVNIMLLSPYVDDIAQLVCDEDIKVLTTGAGNPGKYMDSFKAKGIILIPVVPSVALAKRMEKIGASAVIAEGMESGGHVGKLTTMALVPQVVDAVNIPVIAAGGIADGRGVAAGFALGADAIQMGTRFLVANECTVHENYKKAILKSTDIDTTITGQLTGHPVRVLRNKLTREMEALEKELLNQKDLYTEKFDELGKGALRKAVIEGDVSEGSVMSGQIAGLIKKEQSCKEIIEEIMEEYETTIKNLSNLIGVKI